jgi:hypothetical protein
MQSAMKRRGRPAVVVEPGERQALGLRVTADIKNRLDAAARATGRTQSQEAELRIAATFAEEDRLAETLDLAFRDSALVALVLLIAEAADMARFATETQAPARKWADDPGAYAVLEAAAHRVLAAMRPPGPLSDNEARAAREQGRRWADYRIDVIGELANFFAAYPMTAEERARRGSPLDRAIIARLGPELLDRLRNHVLEKIGNPGLGGL